MIIDELIDLLDAAKNVKHATYSTKTKMWTLKFYKGSAQTFDSDTLLDFLKNG
jgi:hypothetical protein